MSLLVISCGGYHPVKSMIESVKWDGTPRAETIFTDYLGADDNEYVRAVAKKERTSGQRLLVGGALIICGCFSSWG